MTDTRSALTAVAMSGGLDSSVTAWLLAREGLPVVGLSMLLWDEMEQAGRATAQAGSGGGRCCGALVLGDARRVAQQAGIPHYTLRLDREFRRAVVDPFVDTYLAGRTPSPCVACNTEVKFDLLPDRARSFGARRLATGHYARLELREGRWRLLRAADAEKDQTYFLWSLSQDQLAHTVFPLGSLTKPEVRRIASEVRRPVIACLARCHRADLEKAAWAIEPFASALPDCSSTESIPEHPRTRPSSWPSRRGRPCAR